jgi:hypothetical protein
MPFSSVFNKKERCKDGSCKIDKSNIRAVFKPDDGFKDTSIENQLFPTGSYKICDCIIVCKNDNIVVVEILCGTLTYKEFKEKSEQLENCCKVIDNQNLKNKIHKIILQYKKLENPKRNPSLRKKLLNHRICGITLEHYAKETIKIDC